MGMTAEKTLTHPKISDPLITQEMLHHSEWVQGWQYCTVFRQVPAGTPFDFEGRPEGPDWEVNVARGGGSEEVTPVWSDGSVVHQRRYWRRESPGMKPWRTDAHRHEKRD